MSTKAVREGGPDVAVVAVCRECGGWVAVMTEDLERRGGETYREIMRTVADLDLIIKRMPGDEYRSGALQVCHRYRNRKAKLNVEVATDQLEAAL